MITVTDVAKSYGATEVLTDISLSVGSGQRLALVGANGVGKSTLLRILAKVEQPDSGTVETTPGVRLGYLPQEVDLHDDLTVSDYLGQVTGVGELKARLNALEGQLDDPKALSEYSDVQEQFAQRHGYEFEARLQTVLAGFGFEAAIASRPLATLSGGQVRKVALAGLLLQECEVLLLDEPTNNLDLPALIWLERFITTSPAAVIVVSHDRRFLDNVVNKVCEINQENHSLTTFTGGYSDYLVEQTRLRQTKTEAYERQREEIRRLEQAGQERRQWAAKGARDRGTDNDKFGRGFRRDRSAHLGQGGKAIDRRLEQMEPLESSTKRSPLVIPLDPRDLIPGHSIALDNASVTYASGFALGPIDLKLMMGERLAILGKNGAGKTTLLKLLTGEQSPTGGAVRISPELVIGNLMQAHENLPRDRSAKECLMKEAGLNDESAYKLLHRFGFPADTVERKVSELSPGERARLLLAIFAGQRANVLVLDEPTNHLDVEAVSALEEVLGTYAGSVVVVTHDRLFLEHIRIDQTYVLADGHLKQVTSPAAYIAEVGQQVNKLLRRL